MRFSCFTAALLTIVLDQQAKQVQAINLEASQAPAMLDEDTEWSELFQSGLEALMDPERRHAQTSAFSLDGEDPPPAEAPAAPAAPAKAAEAAGDGAEKAPKAKKEGGDAKKGNDGKKKGDEVPMISAKSLMKHKPEDLHKINDEHLNTVLKKAARSPEDTHEALKQKHKSLVDLAHMLEAKAVHHLEEQKEAAENQKQIKQLIASHAKALAES